MHPKTLDEGVLVRLRHGEPVVRWDGDRTEYATGWRGVDVVASDDYLLPQGRFDDELWVDANDDVWRRKVIATAWPCEPGFEHHLGQAADGTERCWHCDQTAAALEPVEFFVLVSAEGFPAQAPASPMPAGFPTARPQQRAEVEEYAGELMRVGSVEARARAREIDAVQPTAPGGGCMINPFTVAVMVLLCLVVGTAGRILYGLVFQ